MFREMARKKQALRPSEIERVLTEEKRGVLSLHGEGGYPYGVPMNFWYDSENGHIYFHSGKKGHKIDAISEDNRVSFCVYDGGFRREGEWALNISSVIVFGRLFPVEDRERALRVYRALSLKFTSDREYIEDEIERYAKNTLCLELRPEHISGKLVNEA